MDSCVFGAPTIPRTADRRLPMTAEEFTATVLGELEAASQAGHSFLATRPVGHEPRETVLSEVAELAGNQFPPVTCALG
jgi:hypothetical protein